MSAAGVRWFRDDDSLLGELRRGGYGPAPLPQIAGFDDFQVVRRGGQGIVYSALQRSTRRRVAIKVLLEGAFASSSSRRRFEREIDLVAALRHPNIVSVYDSGLSADGRLYFAMEFIDGAPLDQYVARQRAGRADAARPAALLALFAKIGEAVNYAHQRGVIHRDLKPGNILVDDSGEPHVCDFGLAKATHDDAGGPGAGYSVSETGQFMGSLPWASPEQLEGAITRIDVRTDVYSLGAILYQMLTGHLPYDVGGGVRAVFDRIATVDPARPSAVAAGLDDEIDTIVMKCLAKDPLRRYQSTAELVADVRHYLAGEPIQAKRDSAWYTLRKTLRRYQVAAAVTLVVVAALAISLAVSLRSWRQAALARDAARAESSQRAAIGDFLQRMLTSVDPGRDGHNVRFLDVVDHAAGDADATLAREPVVEVQVRRTLGTVYSALGLYEKSENQLRRALALARERFGPRDRTTLELEGILPWIVCVQGRIADAVRDGRAARDAMRAALGEEDAMTLRMEERLGDILTMAGRASEAEPLLRRALDVQTRRFGERHPDTLETMNALAVLLKQSGRFEEAERLYRTIVAIKTASLPPNRPPTEPGLLTIIENLALVLHGVGKLDESEALQRQTLKTRLDVLGEDHPDTLTTMSNLATLLNDRGRRDEAAELLEKVVAAETRTLGEDNPATLTAVNNLAKVRQDLGDLDAAERLFRKAYQGRRRVLPPDHAHTLLAAANLASVLEMRGRYDESLKLQQEVLDARRRALGNRNFDTIISMNNVAMQLHKHGRGDEAAPLFDEACRAAAEVLPAGHYAVGLFRGNYGRCLMALSRTAEAETQLTAACDILEKALGPDDARTLANIRSLVELYEKTGRTEAARPWRAKLPATGPAD